MKFFAISLACILLLLFQANSQDAINYASGYKVGDKVADLKLINLVNYPASTAKLSDFKGKLVILDFWNSGCASCITSWPKLQEMQKKYNDQIQIILINPIEDSFIVKNLFNKRKLAGVVDVTLPSVCGDLTIAKAFPHQTVPHIVWLDKNNKVISVTAAAAVSSQNIQAALANETGGIKQKIAKANVDYGKPLFFLDNGDAEQPFLGRSILTKAVPSFRTGFSVYAGEDYGYYIICANSPIKDMYMFAYSNRYYDPKNKYSLRRLLPNRVIMHVKDLSKYENLNNDPDNSYIYQFNTTQKTTVDDLQVIMQNDLYRYFGLTVKKEKRKLKCLVFKAVDKSKFTYREGLYDLNINDVEFSVNNVYLAKVVENMEADAYYFSPYPIIDETGYQGLVGNIKISANIKDHITLNKELAVYGLSLTLQERDVDVVVVSEPKGYVFPYSPASDSLPQGVDVQDQIKVRYPLSRELLMGITKDNPAVLDEYLSAGKINECYNEEYGYSLLALSIKQNAKKCFDRLIANGADVNKACEKTPLMYAAKARDMYFVKALLKAGANVNAVNDENEDALYFAKKYGFTEMIEYLKSLKAK